MSCQCPPFLILHLPCLRGTKYHSVPSLAVLAAACPQEENPAAEQQAEQPAERQAEPAASSQASGRGPEAAVLALSAGRSQDQHQHLIDLGNTHV